MDSPAKLPIVLATIPSRDSTPGPSPSQILGTISRFSSTLLWSFQWSSSGSLMVSNGNCAIQGSSPSETLSWNEDLNINKNEIRTIKKSRNTAKHERERQQNLPRESNKKQENRKIVKGSAFLSLQFPCRGLPLAGSPAGASSPGVVGWGTAAMSAGVPEPGSLY